ncbi:MAG TPA: hypothetical protein VGR07_02265 [Thermoanaerobaculia bacterium]|jgi:hypothetical protein|nr:hypothetical protein [Thermoanaerobaculia bacterium]
MPRSLALGHAAVAVCLIAVSTGCRDSPTEPDRRQAPSLAVTCLPTGVRVACTATLYGLPSNSSVRNVTSLATWRASDPTLGNFLEPGIFTPARRGEVELVARYNGFEDRVTSRFLVDPRQTAQRLYFLSGIVRDDESNQEVSGVMVEVLDGYARGERSITNQFGAYQFDKILTGETFSIRASKSGYTPLTLTYRVDPPVGPAGGNPPFLDFPLRRIG